VLWHSQSDEAGYSSPVAFDAGGARRVVVFTGEGAIGLDLKNGELLWRDKKKTKPPPNIGPPSGPDGFGFFSPHYSTGCAVLKLDSASSPEAREVYFNRDMRNHYSTSVLVGDYLYGYSSSILTAMKFRTGEVAWRDRSVGKGSLTYAEGRLYCLSENGVAGL